VKVADDLRDGLLYAKKLVSEEVKDFQGFVLVKPLDARVVVLVNVAHARFHEGIVEAGMGQLGVRWIRLNLVEIPQQAATPGTCLMHIPIFLDEVFEFLAIVHSSSLPFSNRYGRLALQTSPWCIAAIKMA